jgi:hypothetical protein
MTVTNLAHSVHARLLNGAKQASRPFQEQFQYYAMEHCTAPDSS